MADAIEGDLLPKQCISAGTVPRKPNKERLANQIFLGNEAPIAAVVAVIAVIAHNEVMPGRYDDRRWIHIKPIRQQNIVGYAVELFGITGCTILRLTAFLYRVSTGRL